MVAINFDSLRTIFFSIVAAGALGNVFLLTEAGLANAAAIPEVSNYSTYYLQPLTSTSTSTASTATATTSTTSGVTAASEETSTSSSASTVSAVETADATVNAQSTGTSSVYQRVLYNSGNDSSAYISDGNKDFNIKTGVKPCGGADFQFTFKGQKNKITRLYLSHVGKKWEYDIKTTSSLIGLDEVNDPNTDYYFTVPLPDKDSIEVGKNQFFLKADIKKAGDKTSGTFDISTCFYYSAKVSS